VPDYARHTIRWGTTQELEVFCLAEVRGIPTCAPSKVTAVLPMLMQALFSLSSIRVRGKKQNAGDEDFC